MEAEPIKLPVSADPEIRPGDDDPLYINIADADGLWVAEYVQPRHAQQIIDALNRTAP